MVCYKKSVQVDLSRGVIAQKLTLSFLTKLALLFACLLLYKWEYAVLPAEYEKITYILRCQILS